MTAIYQGQVCSQQFLQRWRSGKHVGAAKPIVKVEYRTGKFARRYHTGNEWTHTAHTNAVPESALFGEVAGGNGQYFYADWTPFTPWTEITQVYDVHLTQDFQKNGVTSATLTIDNTILDKQTGAAGLFHRVEEGWWTPLRGYTPPGYAKPPQAENANFQKLPNAQIRVWAGYGDDTLTVVFLGLIDSLDVEGGGSGGSQGAQVTINSRDFGGCLVDEHLYNWNIDPMIKDPVTFVPRSVAEDSKRVSGAAFASSHEAGHPASLVSVSGGSGGWRSRIHDYADATEWIEVAIPGGSNEYSGIYVNPEWGDMNVYVSVHARVRSTQIKGQKALVPCRWIADNNQLSFLTLDASNMQVTNYVHDPYSGGEYPEGWVDLSSGAKIVPGDTGIPYILEQQKLSNGGKLLKFGGSFLLGANSRIRLSFRPLHKVRNNPPGYQAGVTRIAAEQRTQTAQSRKANWIIIDDVAEIVETCLRWAGFKSWEIQTTGVELKTPYVAGKAKTFMDVINDVKAQTGYTFFIAEPKSDTNDLDIGTPVFRQTRILDPRQQATTEILSDNQLLTGSRINYTNQDERFVIRVRGHMLSKKKGGSVLNGDPNYRAMFVYWPPWFQRMSGVIKQLTHYDPLYITRADCQFAAYLIALQIALADITGVISTAGTPSIGLDTFVKIQDRSSGTTGRMYVTNRTLQYTAGEQAKFISSFGGSIVDTPDVQEIIKTYQTAAEAVDRNDSPLWANPPKRRDKHTHVIQASGDTTLTT